VRARSPDFADFLPACAPVLQILRTLCPRAHPFSELCGLFVRVRVWSVYFGDFPALNHVKLAFSGWNVT
jgi:hypothetical protein